MHEFGLCEAIVDTARARAQGRPVARLRVQMGVLLRAEEESMDMAFSMVTAGTELEGAALDIVAVPASATCEDCGASFSASDPWPTCPRCGQSSIELEGGQEMILEALEYRPDVKLG